ncbi:hypothetical protein RM50_17900 [Pseudarthrobacter phenanthrenivorans]|uniref:Uncharacterized protein n=1 Tax=Pseudarthrobacter phenanthrenivorans TaxID=361575 RepID=A0A0B4ECU8_PSEPS|nr:hypothetical protein RM50_17900 [Pseudarthrobacter phenanthrenivorans]
MVSGAGRRLTVRSVTARAARFATEAGSRRYAAARTAAMMALSPKPSSAPVSAASSSSTPARSPGDRQMVSFTISVTRHSFNAPARNAAKVRGIPVKALASPSSREPRFGDSRRANAICAATPAPCSSTGTPASACSRRCDRSKATLASACRAPATHFRSSNPRI